MNISVIIPTYNEADNIGLLVTYLIKYSNLSLAEIIVSDGNSTDTTIIKATDAGATAVLSPSKGRAVQMNYGASIASGDILYFVHADTWPPITYLTDVVNTVNQGYDMGRYLSAYSSKSKLLKLNALLSRLDVFAGMGGDQTLFITKKLFDQTGGFDVTMKIMEEFEFCARARKQCRYKIIKKPVLISARKYETNHWFTVQRANYTIMKMYRNGASQECMVRKYANLLNYPR